MTTNGIHPFPWNYCAACGLELAMAHDGESLRPYCGDCSRFYYHNPVPATCCFVRRQEDELLLVQRAVEPCIGSWSLPGGFMELGETCEEGAMRELREETGLIADSLRMIGVSTRQSPTHGAIIVLGYIVDVWHGELMAGSDALDLRFFNPMDRPGLPFSIHRELLAIYERVMEAEARV